MGTNLANVVGEHRILLDPAQQEALNSLILQVTADPYADFEEFLVQANLVFHQFPASVRRALIDFRRFSNIEGALLIRGLPTDPNLPETPLDSRRNHNKTTILSELWLCAVSTALGEPIAYIQEKDGEIFQNVCPTQHNESVFSSESSRIFLPFHTETAFHPFMPSHLLLYCLRQDHDCVAQTLLASIRRIYPLLDEHEKMMLRQSIFETGIDYSFGSPNAQRGGGLVTPILYGDEQDPYIRFDPDLMKAHTDEGDAIMSRLTELVNDVSAYVLLEPGDLLIVDNRRAVHARTEYTARYDGSDRWLQRFFLVDSLADSASDRRHFERVIRTTFSV